MAHAGSLPVDLKLSSLQDPGDRYKLGELLGSGAYSEVFEAADQQTGKTDRHYRIKCTCWQPRHARCEHKNKLTLDVIYNHHLYCNILVLYLLYA
jgi:serine/threonine protein kinase